MTLDHITQPLPSDHSNVSSIMQKRDSKAKCQLISLHGEDFCSSMVQWTHLLKPKNIQIENRKFILNFQRHNFWCAPGRSPQPKTVKKIHLRHPKKIHLQTCRETCFICRWHSNILIIRNTSTHHNRQKIVEAASVGECSFRQWIHSKSSPQILTQNTKKTSAEIVWYNSQQYLEAIYNNCWMVKFT